MMALSDAICDGTGIDSITLLVRVMPPSHILHQAYARDEFMMTYAMAASCTFRYDAIIRDERDSVLLAAVVWYRGVVGMHNDMGSSDSNCPSVMSWGMDRSHCVVDGHLGMGSSV